MAASPPPAPKEPADAPQTPPLAARDGGSTDAPAALSPGPIIFSAPFRQGLFLVLLAIGTVIVQLRGGSRIDAVLATGVGLLLGFLLYQRRLFILTALVLPPGIVNQLFDQGLIRPYLESAHLLALALGLLAITAVARSRLGWVQPASWSPGVVILALGLLLLLTVASGTASRLIFSFWLPAAVFGALGLVYVIHLFFASSN